ncbi:hypothetical protein H6G51_09025 [Limnothrix sp. FACHB-708]|uniref:hypothetical protein n=1 Tax=Limnothrix sp. FACHB-708 TaxID=2692818 RepID=UPI001685CB23|nr:hypothetical protein [Limnothrix sp. FACHB-708]MBD2553417.1 hypothetical protein [Limnothrix sp. FACHB-708]MBD2590457.1 hypothetical protein [Limnothrix sp. FACHB-406]
MKCFRHHPFSTEGDRGSPPDRPHLGRQFGTGLGATVNQLTNVHPIAPRFCGRYSYSQ